MASRVSFAPPRKYFEANPDVISLASTYTLFYLVCISEKDFSQNRTIAPLLYLEQTPYTWQRCRQRSDLLGWFPVSHGWFVGIRTLVYTIAFDCFAS